MLGYERVLYAERSIPCSPVVLIILFPSVTQGPVVKPASLREHTVTKIASTEENICGHDNNNTELNDNLH